MPSKKIVIAGPSHSGKSVLREGLKDAIISIPGVPYLLVLTACPDGEGSWYQKTVSNHPELAHRCKSDYKGGFTRDFVKMAEESVKCCSLPIFVIDIGGKPSEENEQICMPATHIVILSGDEKKFSEWREFARKTDLTVVAEIYSDYQGSQDIIVGVDSYNILRGSIHHLERGEDVSQRPMVRALANHLLKL